MPEITDSELRLFAAYQNLGAPSEIQKKISDLEKDNATQRDEIRTLQQKAPKDNQVVVAKEDADLLPKIKKLGNVDEISGKLEEGEKAKTRLTELETKQAAAQFAKAAGLADEAVDTLVAIPALSGATFEVRKGKVKNAQGQEVDGEVGYIKLSGEDKAMSFKDAQEKVPALKGLRVATPAGEKPPVSFVQQGDGGNEQDGNDVYSRIRKQRQNEAQAASKENAGELALKKQFGV